MIAVTVVPHLVGAPTKWDEHHVACSGGVTPRHPGVPNWNATREVAA